MEFQLTGCVYLCTDEAKEAVEFYSKQLGLPLVHQSTGLFELSTQHFPFYISQQGHRVGMALEFLVNDLKKAGEFLKSKGCKPIPEYSSKVFTGKPF